MEKCYRNGTKSLPQSHFALRRGGDDDFRIITILTSRSHDFDVIIEKALPLTGLAGIGMPKSRCIFSNNDIID